MKSIFPKHRQLTSLVYSKQVSILVCEQCGAGKTQAVLNQYGQIVDTSGGATLVKGANGKYRCKEHIGGVLKPRRERRGNTKQDKKERRFVQVVNYN